MILVVGAILVDSLRSPTRLPGGSAWSSVGLAGGWEFPGGKVEPGEDPIDALHRELAEELAVEVELGVEFENPTGGPWPISRQYEMRTWFAEVRAGTLASTGDHDQLSWLDRTSSLDVSWLVADRPIVQRLRSWLLDRTASTNRP